MLWMLTDFSKTGTLREAADAISRAIDAGVRMVTLRNNAVLSEKNLHDMASNLIAAYPETSFFIHGNIALAEMLGCFNLHLSSSFLPAVADIKEEFPYLHLSVSTHCAEQFEKAFFDGADFAFYSPVFRPFSKPDDTRSQVEPVNRENLYLLGGMTRERAENLIEKGFYNIAGISLFYGENAERDIKYLTQKIKEAQDA